MPTIFEQQDRTVDGSSAIDNSAVDGESINEKALMIESMELVEPRKKTQVPNHLLETKTYAKVGQNEIIHAKPAVVHFEGFEVGEKQTKRLVLLNASSDVLRMHIIPPQTPHFCVKYTKPARMVAGTTLECLVEFVPDEWRYYYDCIRIHCPGEENLVVPIHGYPIMSTKDFPTSFTFPSIPVGHRLSQRFPLKCMAPIDFEFNIKYLQPHPAFLVEPLNGIVPANSEAEVTVTFAPFEFQTATMKIELGISQFNSKGVVCTFVGSSLPGLLKRKTVSSVQSEILDPRAVSPLERVRNNRRAVRKTGERKTTSAPAHSLALEKDGVRFPAAMDNPSAVARVLMQEPGKLKVNEMRENMLAKKATSESSRQMKEAVFEHSVRQDVYEERQNQLRWQVKVGEDPISSQSRFRTLEDRSRALKHYMFKIRGDPVADDEFSRPQTTLTDRRTLRNIDTWPASGATFDTYSNDMWAVRHAALDKFVEAARKIVIRNRAMKKLVSLKAYLLDWSRKKYASSSDLETRERLDGLEGVAAHGDVPDFCAAKVQGFKFPTYIPPNVKDDMAPDALGTVPCVATEVLVKRDVPFFGLKVPQLYRLQGYSQHSTHTAASGYLPTSRVRCLRTGAQEEAIHLPTDIPLTTTAAAVADNTDDDDDDEATVARSVPMTTGTTTTAATATAAATAAGVGAVTTGGVEEMLVRQQPVTFTPPEALFKSPEYPSLQIVNPAPGLQVFQPPMTYAEVDYDYHLCPLPRFTHAPTSTSGKAWPTQRKFLDREDTIRGIMGWRKFPSQGLTSLSNHPTLTSVWVPRWDDSFSQELLPESVPPLYHQLDPDDADNVMEEEEGVGEETGVVTLKPEMVSAQFDLIDPSSPSEDQKMPADMFPYGNRMPATNIPVGSHGPVAREKREEELEYFITKKYNRLGSKVKEKVTSLNSLLSDRDMVLK